MDYRHLSACRSVWAGLPTFILQGQKEVVNPCTNADTESADLLVSHLNIKAGFTLTDPKDPRYQKAQAHRTRFGNVSKLGASVLRTSTKDEDHIDAVLGVAKAIDVYLLDYGLAKMSFDALQKSYTQARE